MADQNLPKDRNERVREDAIRKGLLKKREEGTQRAIPLTADEMVEDAFSRGVDASIKWTRKNFQTIQWVIVGGVVAGVAWYAWDWQSAKRTQAATGDLVRGVAAELGEVRDTPEKPSDDAPPDPTPKFKTYDERREAALSAYRNVAQKYPSTGAGILAKLGEAGALLDKREWDAAITAFQAVRATPLAAADLDVRARAIEGTAYALEGKGDLEGASKAFRELENTDAKGLKELGLYGEARIAYAKGDRDKAKELLKTARERMHSSSTDEQPSRTLARQVDDLLRRIDPSAVPPEPPSLGALGGGQGLDAAQMERLRELLRKQGGGPGGKAPGGP